MITDEKYFKIFQKVNLNNLKKKDSSNKNDENIIPIEPNEKDFKKGLSHFGQSCESGVLTFLKMSLKNKELNSLKGIESFKYLEEIDMSHNKWKNIVNINNLNFLIKLTAKYNLIQKIDNLDFPNNILNIDWSNNKISSFNLSNLSNLRILNLNNNQIKDINLLKNNNNLEIINLENNEIETIPDLTNLKLKKLNLGKNKIKFLINFDKLLSIKKLYLFKNLISKWEEIKYLKNLIFLDLAANKISKLKQLSYLKDLGFLNELDLINNPINHIKFYRIQVIYCLKFIHFLDGLEINQNESIKSDIFFGFDVNAKKEVFLKHLPNEQYIDKRIFTDKMLEQESDDEIKNYDFFDNYDGCGDKIDNNQDIENNYKTNLKNNKIELDSLNFKGNIKL